MDTDERSLRVEIDGRWTAQDVFEAFNSLNALYDIRLVLQILYEDQRYLDNAFSEIGPYPPFRTRFSRYFLPVYFEGLRAIRSIGVPELIQASSMVFPEEALRVLKIQYGSPGFTDLTGIGAIVGHLTNLAGKIIDTVVTHRERNLKNEEQELRNSSLRIQNARDYISLAYECGFGEAEIRQLVRFVDEKQGPLIRLREEGKIQRVLPLEHTEDDILQ